MWFFKKRKARKEAEKDLKKVEQEQKVTKPVEQEQVKPAEVKQAPKPVVEKEEEKQAPKPAVKKEEAPKKSDKEKEDAPKKPAKYHISQNKKENTPHYKEWRVRKEGSTKTIKFFKTQAEAIEYAKDLAENQDSSIVIHKLDGTVRKQDYSKK